ncbi:endonuclease [Polymorphobacter sp. PAMC 29334]|nr:endonuclease [Polymorphobacter sp. PAMC 29334]
MMRHLLTATILAGLATATSAQVVKYSTTPPGRILQGASVGSKSNMLFLSGQLASPIDASKSMNPASMTVSDFGDTKTQTISTLNKIKAALMMHGFTMADIVKMTVFVAGDPAHGGKMDFAGMNEGFAQFFSTADNPTTVARSAFQVAALAGPAFLVEIEVIAAK